MSLHKKVRPTLDHNRINRAFDIMQRTRFSFRLWWAGLLHLPERWAMKYLRRKGWVVFWLDPEVKKQGCRGVCWLKAFTDSQK